MAVTATYADITYDITTSELGGNEIVFAENDLTLTLDNNYSTWNITATDSSINHASIYIQEGGSLTVGITGRFSWNPYAGSGLIEFNGYGGATTNFTTTSEYNSDLNGTLVDGKLSTTVAFNTDFIYGRSVAPAEGNWPNSYLRIRDIAVEFNKNVSFLEDSYGPLSLYVSESSSNIASVTFGKAGDSEKYTGNINGSLIGKLNSTITVNNYTLNVGVFNNNYDNAIVVLNDNALLNANSADIKNCDVNSGASMNVVGQTRIYGTLNVAGSFISESNPDDTSKVSVIDGIVNIKEGGLMKIGGSASTEIVHTAQVNINGTMVQTGNWNVWDTAVINVFEGGSLKSEGDSKISIFASTVLNFYGITDLNGIYSPPQEGNCTINVLGGNSKIGDLSVKLNSSLLVSDGTISIGNIEVLSTAKQFRIEGGTLEIGGLYNTGINKNLSVGGGRLSVNAPELILTGLDFDNGALLEIALGSNTLIVNSINGQDISINFVGTSWMENSFFISEITESALKDINFTFNGSSEGLEYLAMSNGYFVNFNGVIPEPSYCAAVLGVAAVAFAMRRKRSGKKF